MKCIVGLGNPGRKYENTLHNMGFLAVDEFAKKRGIAIKRIAFEGMVGEEGVGENKLLLLKPMTYMNLSGRSFGALFRYYKLQEEDVLIVYDDVDIPFGTLRIRKGGSAGTHNGMRSIVEHADAQRLPRLRLGIGREHSQELRDYVLMGVSSSEKKMLEKMVERAADAIGAFVERGIDYAMNQYNGDI